MYLGEAVPPDAAAPIVGNVTAVDGTLHARVHDHKSPSGAHDSQAVAAEGDGATLPMAWYGEHLWRVDVPQPGEYRVCATDAAGNQTCSDPVTVAAEG